MIIVWQLTIYVVDTDLFGWASGDAESYELEEGEWIPEDDFDVTQASENITDEGTAFALLLIFNYLTLTLVIFVP